MRIIGYARVSKAEQAAGNALDNQIARLEQAGVTETIREIGSGSRGKRPKFEQLRQDIRDKNVDQVVVTRIDRLSRRARVLHDLKDELAEREITLRAIDQDIDTSKETASIALNLYIAMAETEADTISSRTKHGWEKLRERREAMNPPFGYRKNRATGKHELDNKGFLCLLEDRPVDYPIIATRKWTKENFEDWAKGEQSHFSISHKDAARELVDTFLITKSLRKTIQTFNLKYGLKRFEHSRITYAGFEFDGLFQRSPSGLAKWLVNPVLQGHLVYFGDDKAKKKIHYDAHPDQRLITDGEYREIQTIFKVNRERRGYGSTEKSYPLSGLVKCGVCGGTCYSSKAGKDSTRRHKRDYGYYYCKNGNLRTCEMRNYVRMDWIEEQVYFAFLVSSQDIEDKTLIPIEETEDPLILAKQRDLERLQESAHIPGVSALMSNLAREIDDLRGLNQESKIGDVRKKEFFKTIVDPRYWRDLTDDQKFFIYHDLIEKISVKPTEVQRIAKTNNEPTPRKRKVNWECEVTLNFDQRPNRTLNTSIDEFIRFKRATLAPLQPPFQETEDKDTVIVHTTDLVGALKAFFNADQNVR